MSLAPLARALRHNTWYTHFTMSGFYRPDAMQEIAACFRHNAYITTLDLSEVACCETTPELDEMWPLVQLMSNTGFSELGKALLKNPNCGLTSVNISHNILKDKGVS